MYIFRTGHMTKVVAMLINGKKNFKFYINNDPGLTLAYFMARLNLVPQAFALKLGMVH